MYDRLQRILWILALISSVPSLAVQLPIRFHSYTPGRITNQTESCTFFQYHGQEILTAGSMLVGLSGTLLLASALYVLCKPRVENRCCARMLKLVVGTMMLFYTTGMLYMTTLSDRLSGWCLQTYDCSFATCAPEYLFHSAMSAMTMVGIGVVGSYALCESPLGKRIQGSSSDATLPSVSPVNSPVVIPQEPVATYGAVGHSAQAAAI